MLSFHSRPPRSLPLSRAIIAALLALVAVPAGARAQAAATRTTLVYLHGNDTLAVETLAKSAEGWTGDLATRGQPRILWRQPVSARGLGSLSIEVYAPGAPDGTAPIQRAGFTIVGDTAHVEILAGGAAQKQAIPTKPGALALVNTSLAHTALLAAGVLAQGRSAFDAVLVSGGQTLGGTATRIGDTLVIVLQGIEMRARLSSTGMPVEIMVPSQQLRVVPATGGGMPSMRPVEKPSYDAPAGAPYTAEHVRIPTDRGYELAATLTRPTGSRLTGVAVTISGSGQQDRDSRIAIVNGYAIFREIADTLARRGIATLRFDDRGYGESGGVETLPTVTSISFADDVRSIVDWLRKRPDIDPSRIALVGHSEGGIIAPMVAVTDPQIRAIALLAGSAYDGKRIVMFQNQEVVNAIAGATPAQRDSIMQTVPARVDSLGQTNNWFGFFLSHDPLPVVRQVRQPVLILQGETDRQVTPEQADTLATALRESGNRNVTIKRFPATNHLFLEDDSGAPQGYSALKNTRVRREVLGTLADWLVAQFAGARD